MALGLLMRARYPLEVTVADDITHAILRQMSEKLGVLEDIKLELKQFKEETGRNFAELRTEAGITNQRLGVVEHTLRDVAAQVLLVGRYVKNSHEKAIVELRRRVGKLEKKVG